MLYKRIQMQDKKSDKWNIIHAHSIIFTNSIKSGADNDGLLVKIIVVGDESEKIWESSYSDLLYLLGENGVKVPVKMTNSSRSLHEVPKGYGLKANEAMSETTISGYIGPSVMQKAINFLDDEKPIIAINRFELLDIE